MNKARVAARLRQSTGLPEEEAEIALETVLTCIKESLTRGEDVKLFRFGTFAVKKRRARIGRNPRTGESIKTPAKSVAIFRSGQIFYDQLQESLMDEEHD